MKRGLIEQRSISSDDPWLPEYMNLIGTNPYGAVSVTSGDLAMKIAAVYRSVSILSGTIASLPLYPMRKKNGKNFTVDYENALYSLLRWKSSDRLSAY